MSEELGCDFGIVLTASHNPKEYNGYKVYWNDGGQLVPPHDKAVIEKVRATGFEDIRWDANESLIETVGTELDEKYTDMIASLSLSNAGKNNLNIVYRIARHLYSQCPSCPCQGWIYERSARRSTKHTRWKLPNRG